jgi:tRNA_anti-like
LEELTMNLRYGWLVVGLTPLFLFAAAQGQAVKDKVEKKEVEFIDADKLTKAFEDDEAAAKKKYGTFTPLVVTGTVNDVKAGAKGDTTVVLKGHKDSLSVACNFKEKDAVKTVTKGKSITVAGAGMGKMGSEVVVDFCSLIPGPVPSPKKDAPKQD